VEKLTAVAPPGATVSRYLFGHVGFGSHRRQVPEGRLPALPLTAADTVIHYDPWWNPAVERQATDRAHRIGQDKAVFVYKLVTAGTVETAVLDLQARKQALADGLYDPETKQDAKLTEDDLAALFAPLT